MKKIVVKCILTKESSKIQLWVFFSFVIVVALSFLGAPSLLRSKQTPILISFSKRNNSKLKKWAKSVYFVTGKVSTDLSDQLSTFFLDISTKIRLWAKNSSKVNKVWRFLRQIAVLKVFRRKIRQIEGTTRQNSLISFHVGHVGQIWRFLRQIAVLKLLYSYFDMVSR